MAGSDLTLLHTNDVHSNLTGWLRLAGKIKAERASAGHVLYVDAGDHQDRSQPEVETSAGRINLELLHAAGCDAAAWGNGEVVGYTPGQLAEMISLARYPVLMANLRVLGTAAPVPGAKSAIIHEVGGVGIGLIGLMVPFGAVLPAMDLTTLPEIDVVEPLVQDLRRQGCDLIVCISHLGLFADRLLAAAVPEIDIICGAHTHHVLPQPEEVNGCLILQAGLRASHLGRLRINLKPGNFRRFSYDLLPITPGLPPDPQATTIIDGYRARARRVLNEVITVLPDPVPHELEGPYPLVSAVAAELRQRVNADVGLVHTGLFLHGLPAGPVTKGDLLAACPSVLYAVSIDLPGRELQRALVQARQPEKIYHEIWAGARGKYVGSLAAAGPDGPFTAAAAINPNRTYRVATTGFMIFRFTGYDGLAGGGQVRWHMDQTARQIAADVLAAGDLSPLA